MIRAGMVTEANRLSGDWVFVDLGFAKHAKTCGLLIGDGEAEDVSFSELRRRLLDLIRADKGPINLLIEAPLSVAFVKGNPTGRSIERRDRLTRYWYVGLGCSVLVAATYLLRDLHDANSDREIRLFEGMASFKEKGIRSSHSEDVRKLRAVIWAADPSRGRVVAPEDLAVSPQHDLQSAFRVAGLDLGVPPVVVLEG